MKSIILIIVILFSSLSAFAQLKTEDLGQNSIDPSSLSGAQNQNLASQLQNSGGEQSQISEAQMKKMLQDLKAAEKLIKERNEKLEELYNEM